MNDQELVPIIKQYAAKYYLDAYLVLAIIGAESCSNPFAVRYEPNWKYFFRPDYFAGAQIPSITLQTERVFQATSWGLMQVMGAVAREHGFKGMLTELVKPDLNLNYGCLHLLRMQGKYREREEWVSAYNAGQALKLANGQFVNQHYVSKVMSLWNNYKKTKVLD